MSRLLTVGTAQLGPIARNDYRTSVVARLLDLMRQAHTAGCRLVVFPELTLTTFFPRWYMTDQAEIDAFFETEMPGPETQPLFEAAAKLGIGFYLGYAELTEEEGQTRHYNTSILVDEAGRLVGKYRKVHLPGHAEYEPQRPLQHLEKRYFDVGDLGFSVWRAFGGIVGMCLCSDLRWPETYRVMGLKGVEMIVLGYNMTAINAARPEPVHRRMFHNRLAMQAGAYQNSTYVVAAAKAGIEEDVPMIGGSCIIGPSGEIITQAQTDEDELIVAQCDLDLCNFGKETVFNFANYRRIEHYKIICEQTGVVPI
jgi:predicted amidohydrolase